MRCWRIWCWLEICTMNIAASTSKQAEKVAGLDVVERGCTRLYSTGREGCLYLWLNQRLLNDRLSHHYKRLILLLSLSNIYGIGRRGRRSVVKVRGRRRPRPEVTLRERIALFTPTTCCCTSCSFILLYSCTCVYPERAPLPKAFPVCVNTWKEQMHTGRVETSFLSWP